MTDLRQLIVKTDIDSFNALSTNHYNLQLARCVVKDDTEVYNIVWQTSVIAPSVSIQWKLVYGLNWTITENSPGMAITLSSAWTQCDTGKALDIGTDGMFIPSTLASDPGYIGVGKNNFKPGTATNGIHILIGLQRSDGGYDVIYQDEDELGVNMSAQYKPLDKLQWWYAHGVKTATVKSKIHGPVETGDWSDVNAMTGSKSKTSAYNFKEGTWTTTTVSTPVD